MQAAEATGARAEFIAALTTYARTAGAPRLTPVITQLSRPVTVATDGRRGVGRRAVDAAVNARSQAETALAAVVARNGPTVPLGEALFLPRLPARIRPQPSQAQDPGGAENAGSLVELSGEFIEVDESAGAVIQLHAFEPGDIAAMTRTLARLIGDPDLRGQLGRAGQARVQAAFSLDAGADRLAARFRRIIPKDIDNDS